MKSLIIVRHAKSSWDLTTPDDFERPLNERGKKDAADMAERLLHDKVVIELFVASPAKRAKKTASLFMQAYQRPVSELVLVPGLYHAPVPVFIEVVSGLSNSWQHVAVFSHNPGITAFVNTLTEVQLDNMPTCGIFAIEVHTDDWREFTTAEKTFRFFDYPKSAQHT